MLSSELKYPVINRIKQDQCTVNLDETCAAYWHLTKTAAAEDAPRCQNPSPKPRIFVHRSPVFRLEAHRPPLSLWMSTINWFGRRGNARGTDRSSTIRRLPPPGLVGAAAAALEARNSARRMAPRQVARADGCASTAWRRVQSYAARS